MITKYKIDRLLDEEHKFTVQVKNWTQIEEIFTHLVIKCDILEKKRKNFGVTNDAFSNMIHIFNNEFFCEYVDNEVKFVEIYPNGIIRTALEKESVDIRDFLEFNKVYYDYSQELVQYSDIYKKASREYDIYVKIKGGDDLESIYNCLCDCIDESKYSSDLIDSMYEDGFMDGRKSRFVKIDTDRFKNSDSDRIEDVFEIVDNRPYESILLHEGRLKPYLKGYTTWMN